MNKLSISASSIGLIVAIAQLTSQMQALFRQCAMLVEAWKPYYASCNRIHHAFMF